MLKQSLCKQKEKQALTIKEIGKTQGGIVLGKAKEGEEGGGE